MEENLRKMVSGKKKKKKEKKFCFETLPYESL